MFPVFFYRLIRAESLVMSLNSYITDLIDKDMPDGD